MITIPLNKALIARPSSGECDDRVEPFELGCQSGERDDGLNVIFKLVDADTQKLFNISKTKNHNKEKYYG
jgi:hypothetical protein